jgi:hypothetical protein
MMVSKPLAIIVVFFILIGCKEDTLNKKNSNKDKPKTENFKAIAIHDCTTAEDTIFKDNDHIKYVALKNKSYGVEIKIGNRIDTLDFTFDCNSPNGSIPKLVFKDETLLLAQGNGFHYRNAILCNLDKATGTIQTSEFETGIVYPGEGNDFFVYTKNNLIFIFDRDTRELLCTALPKQFQGLQFIEAKIFKEDIDISFEGNKALVCNIADFKLKGNY